MNGYELGKMLKKANFNVAEVPGMIKNVTTDAVSKVKSSLPSSQEVVDYAKQPKHWILPSAVSAALLARRMYKNKKQKEQTVGTNV